MDLKRVATTIIGIPLVGLILAFGNKYVIDVAISIIAIMSLHEYFKAFRGKHKPVEWIGYVFATLIAFTHVIDTNIALRAIGAIIPIIMTILFLHVIFSNMKINIIDISITLFGVCYIVLFLWFIPIIRQMNNGGLRIWMLFIVAWGTDISAFIIGKTIGKHKFSKTSPNKTIEGCIGGIIGAIICMLIYTYICNIYFRVNWNYGIILLITVILSIVGQIGDFSASTIKRYTEVKDFSNLIPGHGGMLDRIDSLIFIAPFAYVLLTYLL